MTTSRVIRGTRAKVFLYICGIFIIVGIIACYNNTLSQLDDVKKSNDICRQQKEDLSTELQVISDYKQRLQKSLKTEQADHQQIKTNLNNQLKEERSKYEKESNDMKLKLGSLQQHFNLLQTQYDDYKEETGKTQKQQQEEINNLEARISELIEEQKKIRAAKENLRLQYEQVQQEKRKLEEDKEINNNNIDNEKLTQLSKENEDLKTELKNLKEKCNINTDIESKPEPYSPSKNLDNLESPGNLQSDNKQQDNLPVLPEPNNDSQKIVSLSSTASNKLSVKPSKANIGVARPIFVPTVTPGTPPKDNKLPDGVVAIPDKKEDEIVNARYQNAKESARIDNVQNHKLKEGNVDADKDNGANEIFDAPIFHDGLQFNENEQLKQVDKPNYDKKHIDALGKDKKNYEQDQGEYKELQNDVQLEENDDDDAEGYDDHLGRQKEPAVRN